MIQTALISVSNKSGIVEFAKRLVAQGITLYSTGGTLRTLEEAQIPVQSVTELTHFPEMMDGRVKTLHPHIHGGILARRDVPSHVEAMKEHHIEGIDLVVVNLYPFRETIAKEGVTLEEAVEQIDIGGPTMVRSAAKNFAHVGIVVNPDRYDEVARAIEENGELPESLRFRLSCEAFTHTASYDAAISQYMQSQIEDSPFSDTKVLSFHKVMDLRYGENPHQRSAFYIETGSQEGFAKMKQLQGKELSYNNIVDIESAWALVNEFKEPAATIIKHTNPCGTAIGTSLYEAYESAYQADPVSAFGGIVALNREVDGQTAQKMSEIFLEVIVAPAFSEEGKTILESKKNLRLLEMPSFTTGSAVMKQVHGGVLLQDDDLQEEDMSSFEVVTNRKPTEEEWQALRFTWSVVKHVKSNAIVVGNDRATLGVGAGQMNRVGSVAIALEQAGEQAKGSVLASDAFFPFADSVEVAGAHGITAIIQPGGSIRDEESIAKANELGIAMVFTKVRHFKH